VTALVNPQFHDEFVALCALYHSVEISEEEWALLQIHMAYCDSCQALFKQYQQITSDVIPAMAAVAASERDTAEESHRSFDRAERRLMAKLDSLPGPQEIPGKQKFPRPTSFLLIAAGIATIACVAGLYFTQGRSRVVKKDTTALVSHSAPKPAAPSSLEREAQDPPQPAPEKTADLERQLAASEKRLNQSNLALGEVQKQLEAEQAARKQMSEERSTLSAQLASAQKEVDSVRSQMSSTNEGSTEESSRVSTLEATLRELRAALEEKEIALSEKDRMLDLDTDFLAHDRDIRDLIGARNLYIADSTDTTENGKTAKQFGRIFYTKDRSLVFFGFDLDSQAGRKQDVSFQVWGSGSDRSTPVNLGLFYQDDSHKRWVLRCNDAKTLARLDMVFVTVEPPGGSSKPTGKQLLRAYLQIQPNHP
jgi:hypothetical protein